MAAAAGDEDEKPAYMIYIDPETGKYTTEDPETANDAASPTASVADGEDRAWNLPVSLLAAGAVVAVLVGAGLRQRRRQSN